MAAATRRQTALACGALLLLAAAAYWRVHARNSIETATRKQGAPLRTGSKKERHGVPPHERIEFDLSQLSIPIGELRFPGLSKDGIPALTNPALIPADEASALPPEARVIGAVVEGEARAYPLRILNRHEIVNDRIRDVPVAVTYCPLCDSAVIFDRRTPRGEREFGVSGLLYNSNVVMYDRGGDPESLWCPKESPARGIPFHCVRFRSS